MAELSIVTSADMPGCHEHMFEQAEHRRALVGFNLEMCGFSEKTLNMFDPDRDEPGPKVKAILLADDYSRGYTGDKLNLLGAYGRSRHLDNLMRRMRRAGHQASFIHRGLLLAWPPVYSGRSHVKIALADNDVIAGGIDLNSETSGHTDVSLRVHDSRFADSVYGMLQTLASIGHVQTKPLKLTVGDDTQFFVEGALPGESAIRDEVFKLAREPGVTSVRQYTQYIPGGKTSELYNDMAESGVEVKVITNDPNKLPQPFKAAQKLELRRARNHEFALTFADCHYLHAKVVVITKEDGTKTAMIGSHNLQGKDIAYGTAEAAFFTSNQDVIAQAEDYLQAETNPKT